MGEKEAEAAASGLLRAALRRASCLSVDDSRGWLPLGTLFFHTILFVACSYTHCYGTVQLLFGSLFSGYMRRLHRSI